MELFSELYGLYYRLTADILRKAPLSRQQIQSLVAESGFAESTLQLLPKLLDERAWPLLEEKDGLWHSRLQAPPALPLTHLEGFPTRLNLIAEGTLNQAFPVAIPAAMSVLPTPVEKAPKAPYVQV